MRRAVSAVRAVVDLLFARECLPSFPSSITFLCISNYLSDSLSTLSYSLNVTPNLQASMMLFDNNEAPQDSFRARPATGHCTGAARRPTVRLAARGMLLYGIPTPVKLRRP